MSHSPARRCSLAVGLIVFALLVAYSNSFHGAFIFDDKLAIEDNPALHHISSLWSAVYPRNGGLTTAGRPLLCLTLAINYALGGLSVEGYHAVNLLIHVLATLTLFGVVRRTLLLPKLRKRYEDRATGLALAAAMIWGLHPLQTESVTYLVQRAESLVSLFYLLTLYCVIRGELEPNSKRWFNLAIACCALGMASKEVMVTAPVIVLFYERVFVFDTWRDLLRARHRLLIGLAATWLLLGVLIAPLGGRGETAGAGFGVTSWEYLLTQSRAIATYLKLMVYPSPLVLDYGTWVARSLDEVWPSALLVCAVAVATLLALRFQAGIGFLGLWFFVILAPSSSIVPIVSQTIAEHRVYLALAGPLVLLIIAADWLSKRLGHTGTSNGPSRQINVFLKVLLLAIAIVLGVLTWRRNADYRSPLAMWSDAVQKQPENGRVHDHLALALAAAGDPEAALLEANRAIDLEPLNSKFYFSRGTLYLNLNRLDEAFADFSQSVKLKPNAEALQNRGNVYARWKQYESAIADFDEALRLDPSMLLAYRNRALSHFYLQHFEAAQRDIWQFHKRGGVPDHDLLAVEQFLKQ